MTDDDAIHIEATAERRLTVATVASVEHLHDGRPFEMAPETEEQTHPSDQFATFASELVCPDCGTRVRLRATSSLDDDAPTAVIRALEKVVAVAGAGHIPPDHRWQNVRRAACPLCVALDEAEQASTGHAPEWVADG